MNALPYRSLFNRSVISPLKASDHVKLNYMEYFIRTTREDTLFDAIVWTLQEPHMESMSWTLEDVPLTTSRWTSRISELVISSTFVFRTRAASRCHLVVPREKAAYLTSPLGRLGQIYRTLARSTCGTIPVLCAPRVDNWRNEAFLGEIELLALPQTTYFTVVRRGWSRFVLESISSYSWWLQMAFSNRCDSRLGWSFYDRSCRMAIFYRHWFITVRKFQFISCNIFFNGLFLRVCLSLNHVKANLVLVRWR